MDDAVAIASTSGVDDASFAFQYIWPLKVCQRQIEDESIILTLSRPFCTSYKHVQFTWALRLTDEYVISNNVPDTGCARHVLLHLYYKEGPCIDVPIEEIRAEFKDPVTKESLFTGFGLGRNEFTRGSGWPVQVEKSRRDEFTSFIHERIDTNLIAVVEITMKESLFEPLNYLPDVENAFRSRRIETACQNFIEKVISSEVEIPNMDLLKEQGDKFSIHRMIFLYGVDLVAREYMASEENQNQICEKLVKNTFAHIYFEKVLLKEVKYVEDFVSLLEGITCAHIPALLKELERFICQEVMQEPMDTNFAKKMLLIAEKYNLEVLKMVVNGLLVDQIIANSNPPKELVNIAHELEKFANEMVCSKENDGLVGVVVEDLQELTRRVRRVSLSHSPSQSSHNSLSSNSPLATPTKAQSSSTDDHEPFEAAPVEGSSRFKRVSLT
ncbi:unnamed protein product [Caenorhabditis auriculariae]|uniref:BTB domain-containing protein n=1 Tax=Caenorhabditis auriculariae TaxID=2777116 RepID=A0A8S1GMT0_9PELO|nr:unnamed protein product [Caenorhabditis auriculariae]